VAAESVFEVGAGDVVDGARPEARKTVSEIRQPAMNGVSRGQGALLRAEDEEVSGGVGAAVKFKVEIEGGILEQVGLVEGDGGQLQRVVLQLRLVSLHLPNLLRAEGFFGGGSGVRGASLERIDLLRHLIILSLIHI